MIKQMKKFLYSIFSILFALSLLVACGRRNVSNDDKLILENDKNIVILFTNDVHCDVKGYIGYAGLQYYKNSIDQNENYIALVDAGDFSSGSSVGTISKGKFAIDIMKKIGYDFCCPGNHEFDYGMQNFLSNCIELSNIIYCCNFVDLRTKLPVLNPYKIITLGNKRIAFIGAVTPDTFTESPSDYFKDQNGNYIYSLSEDDTGEALYQCIQKAADDARLEGADYVILVGHFGEGFPTERWKASQVVKNTNNIDFVIDGHSHEVYNVTINNKDGKPIKVSQAGNNLKNIGKLTIDKKGNMNAETITMEDVSTRDENGYLIPNRDPEMTSFIDNTIYQYENSLNEIVIYDNPTNFVVNEPETNRRIVRIKETNLGDLVADAHRDVFQSDVALIRGGALHNELKAGNVTYNDCLNISTLNNMACMIKCKGQDIKDALELGASLLPEENGDFFQVSGLTFTIDTFIKPKIVHENDGGISFTQGDYRVRDIKINGEDLDLNKDYTLVCHDYVLANTNTRFTMFKNVEILKDRAISNNDVILTYLKKGFTNDYSNPYGEGRITIK